MDASNEGGHTILPEILNPASRWLFRYWESIRGEKEAPSRSRVEIKSVAAQLPWMFIAEKAATGNLHPLRLAGTGICDLWGGNMTSKCLYSTWARFERDTTAGLFEGVIDQRQPFAMRVRARSAFGNSVSLEILGLPVIDDATGAVQVLGLVMPFRMPEWLGRDHLVSFELSAVRIIWTDPIPQRPVAVHGVHMRNGRPSKSRPSLSVIEGGRKRELKTV